MRNPLLFFLFLVLAGCGGSYHPCREGTVYTTVQFDSASSVATELTINTRFGEKMGGNTKTRNPGMTETIQFTLGSSYEPSQMLVVDVIARRDGVVVGSGHLEQVLQTGCTVAMVNVVGVNNPDGAEVDLASADLASSDAGTADLARGLDGSDASAPDQGGGDLAHDAAAADIDLAGSDAALPDLRVGMEVVADIAMGGDKPDMAMGEKPDIAIVGPDLTPPDAPPPDLAGRDLTLPPDLTTPRDFSPPPDLTVPPDLGPSCTDKVKNGAETDVDCGGGTCPKCGNSKVCQANADCQSNTCSSKVCKAALGQPCSQPSECGSGGCAGPMGMLQCVPSDSAFYKVSNAGNATTLRCVPSDGGNAIDFQIQLGALRRVDGMKYCLFVSGGAYATGVTGEFYSWDSKTRSFCNNFNNNPGAIGFSVNLIPGPCGLGS